MDNDLDILIDFYNEEKSNLERLIKECIEEKDYEFAYFHSNALFIVNQKLGVLNSFKDPFYHEKKLLEIQRKNYEKKISEVPDDIMREYNDKKINEIKSKEQEINKRVILPSIPGQEIDDAIFDVVEGIIESFKIYINRDYNIYLKFQLVAPNKLRIALTPEDLLYEYYNLDEDDEKSLRAIGFVYNEEEKCYGYIYKFERFRNTIFLKTLLSRIFFDTFSYWAHNSTIIEYNTFK